MSTDKYPPLPEPDSHLFQHEDTGLTQYVDSQQVEWGFEKINPRWVKCSEAFTADQMHAYADAAIAADRAARGMPFALLAWANLSDEETQEPWNAGYASARAWVKMQLSAPLQPAAQPELTDNEIDTISDAVACDPRRPETDYWRLFARAIIAAHEAKKGGAV